MSGELWLKKILSFRLDPPYNEYFFNTGMPVWPVVNLINILHQLLCQYYFAKKLQSQTVIRENLLIALLYKKGKCKMLMKLIPVVNFTEQIWQYFAHMGNSKKYDNLLKIKVYFRFLTWLLYVIFLYISTKWRSFCKKVL